MAKTKPNDLQKSARGLIKGYIDFLNGKKPDRIVTKPLEGTEAWYRDRLALKLNGKTEVQTPSGRIDILTKTEVIELKIANKYKDAIGQVKCYGRHYPKHKMRIHLFGKLTESKLKNIQADCLEQGIILTWE